MILVTSSTRSTKMKPDRAMDVVVIEEQVEGREETTMTRAEARRKTLEGTRVSRLSKMISQRTSEVD